MSKDVSAKMNPRISEIDIGVRRLRTVTIYPLSVKDQFEFTDLITSTIADFFRNRQDDSVDEAATVSLIIDLIKDNLPKLLEYVLEDPGKEDRDILADLTNEQLLNLCQLIYDVNYGVLGKKVKDLLEKIQEQFPSGRSVATSLDDIQEVLESEKLQEKATEKEESL